MPTVMVKNTDTSAHTWGGQEFTAGMEYTLQDPDFVRFTSDLTFFNHIGDGTAQIGDSQGYFTAPADGWAYLLGHNPGLVSLDSPKALDDKPLMQSTPRPVGTYTFLSSEGDDDTDPEAIGGGTLIELNHQTGDSASVTRDFHINAIRNETYLHGAEIQWKGAVRDRVHCKIVTRSSASAIGSGSDTNYEVVSGVLIQVAGGGTKTVNFASVHPVQMTPNEFGVAPAGYWDCDYNDTTGVFENYVFRADGSGEFNIFAAEIPLASFAPAILMLGDELMSLRSYDVSQLGHNMIVRVYLETRGTDHDWQFCASLCLYRSYTE